MASFPRYPKIPPTISFSKFFPSGVSSCQYPADPLELDFDRSFTNGRLANAAAAYLGTVTTTTANEDVRIFVNGLARTDASDDERTHYGGIAYRLTSGERATTAISR
ncbi:MAG: hypothetical protein ACJAVK_001421 [Akkermansiaceae bacterium]|jgi:hypothetical protein